MWHHTLDRLRGGLAVCVFDISDRLQHMFYRYLDATHPANAGRDTEHHAGAVDEMYRRMDVLVGETRRARRPAHGALRALRSRLQEFPTRRRI